MFGFSRKPELPADAVALQRIILDLTAQLEAKDRQLAVRDAEIESLAAVIVRDRERVKAETAKAIRQRVDSETREGIERLMPK